jgi:4-oxalmesaconate hydratase
MVGAVRGKDPRSGHDFDDTKRYIDKIEWLKADDKAKIYAGNALKVYPRLGARLKAAGLNPAN